MLVVTILGRALGLLAVAGLLWLAMLAATAAIFNRDAGYALFSALFVALAITLLALMVREGRGVEL